MDMSPATLADEDDESIDDEENPELRQLLMQRRFLRKQLNDPEVLVEEESRNKDTSTAFGAESFKPNFTVVVVDTNSLVKHLGTYETMLASNQWPIVISYSGIGPSCPILRPII